MKVTFIRPNMSNMRQGDAMQPLAIAVLKGLTPDDVDTVFYDDRIEEINYDENTDLVAISVETFTAKRSYQIASRFMERGIPVVMGGHHPTLMPDEVLEHADSIVIGDAEGVWPRVLEDAKAKKIERIYKSKELIPLDGIRFDRSILDGKKYLPVTPVQYSRGCKFDCDFCAVHAFYGNSLRQRPVDEVIQEMESINAKTFFIADDNVFINRAKAKELFNAMIPLNRKWGCQISIDAANDDELLKLMKKSGCIITLIGFESLEKRNLEQMNKQANLKHNDYATVISKIQDNGIMLFGTFVFGYDYDTRESFDTTLDFALRSKFWLANFNPLMPMPGTRLYKRLQDEGRLIYDKWWLDPNFKYGESMYIPKCMTPQELTEGCFNIRKQFNTYGAIFRRALDFRTNSRSLYNLSLYLLANIVSRREIFRKQSRSLGD